VGAKLQEAGAKLQEVGAQNSKASRDLVRVGAKLQEVGAPPEALHPQACTAHRQEQDPTIVDTWSHIHVYPFNLNLYVLKTC
jgi:hypothetical protein